MGWCDGRRMGCQLGQSNGSITDGPAVCDNHPSTTGQWTWPSCHEFGVRNEWAEILKLACTMGGPQEKNLHKQWVGPLWQGFMGPMHCARQSVPNVNVHEMSECAQSGSKVHPK
jgi:hypothetical protein